MCGSSVGGTGIFLYRSANHSSDCTVLPSDVFFQNFKCFPQRSILTENAPAEQSVLADGRTCFRISALKADSHA